MPKNKKLTLSSGIQTYQILTNDDEVCFPSLSSILLAVCMTKTQMERGCREAESIPWCYKRSYHLQMLWKLGILQWKPKRENVISTALPTVVTASGQVLCWTELGWAFENNFQPFVFATLRAILSIYFLTFPVGF